MSISASPIAERAISQTAANPGPGKTPPKRTAIATADARAVPEPR